MPQQVTPALSALNDGSGQWNLQVGPYGQSFDPTTLFKQGFDAAKLATALGLAFRIGNYGQPDSVEFLTALNNTLGGIKLPDTTYWITGIANNGNGQYTISLATSKANAVANLTTYTVTMQIPQFQTDNDLSQGPGVLLGSIASWLRLPSAGAPSGYSSLVAAAVTALNKQQFWV